MTSDANKIQNKSLRSADRRTAAAREVTKGADTLGPTWQMGHCGSQGRNEAASKQRTHMHQSRREETDMVLQKHSPSERLEEAKNRNAPGEVESVIKNLSTQKTDEHTHQVLPVIPPNNVKLVWTIEKDRILTNSCYEPWPWREAQRRENYELASLVKTNTKTLRN